MADINSSGLSTLYRIEPLKGPNWLSWKMKIETILDNKGLDSYIEGTKIRPADNSPLADEKDKWDAEDKKTRTIITLLVHDTQVIHYVGAHTAHDLWEQLKAMHEPHSQAGILTWHRKLYGTRAKESTDIRTHLTSMWEIYETLRVMGDKINDQEFKNALMTSLLKSWEQFLMIYTQHGAYASTMTPHELHAVLIEENRRWKDIDDDEEDEDEPIPGQDDTVGLKQCSICKKFNMATKTSNAGTKEKPALNAESQDAP